MTTLRERDIKKLEVQEKHREQIITYYLERRAGRVGEYSVLEQFLGVDRYVEEAIQEGTAEEKESNSIV